MSDLTRWNRAGLDRFRYIDGNAVTFLDLLRREMATRFPQWDTVQLPESETGAAPPHVRMLEYYRTANGEPGRDLLKALAKAAHVLTEHLDVFANEGYLRTATQWDNVRKLVEMLDYHPAPPASASTRLVLEIKPDRAGTVAKGFQVKHQPVDGSPLVFETLEDLAADPLLNALRIGGFGRSPLPVTGASVTVEGALKDVRVGDPVLFEDESGPALAAQRIMVTASTETETRIDFSPSLSAKDKLVKGDTLVHLKPAERLEVKGPGKIGVTGAMMGRWIALKDIPNGLVTGEVVLVTDGARYYFRHVTAVEGRRVQLDEAPGELTLAETWLSRARKISVVYQGGRDPDDGPDIVAVRVSGDLTALADTYVAKIIGSADTLSPFKVFSAAYTPVDEAAPDGGGYTTLKLIDPGHLLKNPQTFWVTPAGRDWRADTFLDKGAEKLLPLMFTTELPKKTGEGDLVAMVSGSQMAWGRLVHISRDEDGGTADMTVDRWRHRGGGRFYLAQTRLLGRFKEVRNLVGWTENPIPVSGDRIRLQDAAAAEAIASGRILVAEQEEIGADALTVTVVRREGADIFIDPPLPEDGGYTIGNTVFRGNTVMAGHGAAKPEKILGSGDAARSNQSFVLAVPEVSFVADARMATGVRADIEVRVAGRVWEQVSSLNDSGPADFHYDFRMTEDGFVMIRFGDGTHGRRLPTGVNNVRVRYRKGTGLGGNLPAGSLEKAVKPHPRVAAVRSPFPATGGNDMESADAMRTNAPSTVLTLDRAVSLTDFANLATGHASVWQARAFRLPPKGPTECVEVVTVAAGGGPLGDLAGDIQAFLRERTVPGVRVEAVTDYQPVLLSVQVVVRVQSAAFDPDTVIRDVRAALLDRFSLERRKIGEPIYLSDIYQVVESVAGVENSFCAMAVGPFQGPAPVIMTGADGAARAIRADRRQLIHLSADGRHVAVKYEEYDL